MPEEVWINALRDPGVPRPLLHDLLCDEEKYEDRNVVARCVGRLKECRRIATRFEKKARQFKAMLQWAFVAEYLAV